MTRNFLTLLLAAAAPVAAAPPGGLTLDEAVRAAMSAPSAEEANVIVAESRVRFLEAMGRRRIDVSPQMGLFAAASPLAAITQIGAGLLVKQGTVPAILILEARADVAAARASQRRKAFQREMDATSRFYDLVEHQNLADSACAASRDIARRRSRVESELAIARATQADLVRHDLQALDRESECLNAESRRRAAEARLAAWMGESGGALRAEVELPALKLLETPLRDTAQLVHVAIAGRVRPQTLDNEAASLRKEVLALKPPSFTQLAVGGASQLSSGSFHAGKALVLAKLDALERELEEHSKEVGAVVAETKIRVERLRAELAIAKKRANLTRQQAETASVRYRAGLAGVAVLASAEAADHAAMTSYLRTEWESRISLATLIRVCGLPTETLDQQLRASLP